MLVAWGTAQADAAGLPALIEAGALGLSLYLKYGFKPFGEVKTDMNQWGVDHEMVLTLLRREPAATKSIAT